MPGGNQSEDGQNCACITAKNEAGTIGQLVASLKQQGLPAIVVDDGSKDGTGSLAYLAGAVVIWHARPRGIGPSLIETWREALRLGCQGMVQLDAGGSHDPRDALALISGLSHADIVIGSRFVPGAQYRGKPIRKCLSRIAAWACNRHSPVKLADWTSGYRAFSRRALLLLASLPYEAKMHGWQIEVLFKALGLGLSVAEVPIVYYASRSTLDFQAALEAFWVWRKGVPWRSRLPS